MEKELDDLPRLEMEPSQESARGTTYRGTASFPKLDPWFVRFKAQDVSGQLAITELTIDIDPLRAPVDSTTGEPIYPERGITARLLGTIRVGALLRALRSWLSETARDQIFEVDSPAGQLESAAMAALKVDSPAQYDRLLLERDRATSTLEATAPPTRAGRRQMRGDDFLRELAERRLAMQARGLRGATSKLAEHFGIASSTVETHIIRAGEEGWLEPGVPGQPTQTRHAGERLNDAWAAEGFREADLVAKYPEPDEGEAR